MNNFNLRKFLTENKLTPTSKILKEVSVEDRANLIKNLTHELEYVWKMGKGNNPINFQEFAESIVSFVFGQEAEGMEGMDDETSI